MGFFQTQRLIETGGCASPRSVLPIRALGSGVLTSRRRVSSLCLSLSPCDFSDDRWGGAKTFWAIPRQDSLQTYLALLTTGEQSPRVRAPLSLSRIEENRFLLWYPHLEHTRLRTSWQNALISKTETLRSKNNPWASRNPRQLWLQWNKWRSSA